MKRVRDIERDLLSENENEEQQNLPQPIIFPPFSTHFLMSYGEQRPIDKANFVMPKYYTQQRSPKIIISRYGHTLYWQTASEYHSYTQMKMHAHHGHLNYLRELIATDKYIMAYLSLPKAYEDDRYIEEYNRRTGASITHIANSIEFDVFNPATISAHEKHYQNTNYFYTYFPHYQEFLSTVFPKSYEFYIASKLREIKLTCKHFSISSFPQEVTDLIVSYLTGASKDVWSNSLKIRFDSHANKFMQNDEIFETSTQCVTALTCKGFIGKAW